MQVNLDKKMHQRWDFYVSSTQTEGWVHWTSIKIGSARARAVASLTIAGGQKFHFPHFPSNFDQVFLLFPQIFLIFFLTLALRVGESPTREGPGYTTGKSIILSKF